MESVFIVQHLHILPNEQEDLKFIGAYRSRASALAAVERLHIQPGFSDFPKVMDPTIDDDEQGFHIDEYRLDQDNWPEGYVTL